MKKLIWAIFTSITILSCSSAHADSITGAISGDDNISYWNGSSWVAEGTNWKNSETIDLTVTSPTDIVYFAVSNNFSAPGSGQDGGNPASFIASFTDNTGTFEQTGTSKLLSNTANFKILAVDPWLTTPAATLPNSATLSTAINPTFDPTGLTGFITPTSYGTNGNAASQTFPYSASNGGPISGINNNADFIWTGKDTGFYATTDDYAVIEVNLGVNPLVTPEPPTLFLFAFAGALFLLFNRRKMIVLS